ncbi:glutamate decarboxylase [Pantoea rodasii]|nr:glutamate decarboxylase [Pantoea rodasii]
MENNQGTPCHPLTVLPKRAIPSEENSGTLVKNMISDELILDGSARLNLATFCQTSLEPEIHQLMDAAIDKNLIDKDEYPVTAEIEQRCVRMLARLWHAPEADTTMGCSTVGSSEAAMLAGLAAKFNWRKRRMLAGQPVNKPNLVCGPVQVCWHKFCRYFDIELREIPMSKNRLLMSPEEVLSRVDENTICVVATFGVTFTGQYEPVLEISKALDEFEATTGIDVPLHVDAASGGFLAPFCAEQLVWDFRIPRVKSINASGHKYGLAPLGAGWVIWRSTRDLPEELIFNVNYLGGEMPTFALNFSRPGGQIISQYYNLVRYGFEGYKRQHNSCYEVAHYLASQLQKTGLFNLIFRGDKAQGLPAVAWTLKNPQKLSGYTLYEFGDRLRQRGWQIPAYSLPDDCCETVIQRIVVRRGFTMDLAQVLINDMKSCISHFHDVPVDTEHEIISRKAFNHN